MVSPARWIVRLAEDLLLNCGRQQIALDVGHAGPRPVSAEQGLVRDLFQAREIFQQQFGRDAADIEIDIGMAAQ